MVQRTRDGEAHQSNWSVGQRVKGIEDGDRIFLLRQGEHGRGIVARGQVASEIYYDDGWREGDAREAGYVDVVWLEALPIADRIDLTELVQTIPEYGWKTVYGSGRDVSKYESRLEDLWRDRVSRTGLKLLSVTDRVETEDAQEPDGEADIDDDLEALLDLSPVEIESAVEAMGDFDLALAMDYFDLFDGEEDDPSVDEARERLIDGIIGIQDDLAELTLPPENPKEIEKAVRGAGFGTAEENRRVELAAVQTVMDTLRSKGYNVASVESLNLGWDLTARREGEELHIEVKGAAGAVPKFFLTGNEFRTSRTDPAWVLAVVTSALTSPQLQVFDKELLATSPAILYSVDLSECEPSPDALG